MLTDEEYKKEEERKKAIEIATNIAIAYAGTALAARNTEDVRECFESLYNSILKRLREET